MAMEIETGLKAVATELSHAPVAATSAAEHTAQTAGHPAPEVDTVSHGNNFSSYLQKLLGLSKKDTGVERKALHKGAKKADYGKADLPISYFNDFKQLDNESKIKQILKYNVKSFEDAAATHSETAKSYHRDLTSLAHAQSELGKLDAGSPDLAKLRGFAAEHGIATTRLVTHDVPGADGKIIPISSQEPLSAKELHAELTSALADRVQNRTFAQADALGKAKIFQKFADLRRSPTQAQIKSVFGDKPFENSASVLNYVFLFMSIPSMFTMFAQLMPAKKQDQDNGSASGLQNESPPLNPSSLRPRAIVNAQAQQIRAQQSSQGVPMRVPAYMQAPAMPPNVMNQAFTGVPPGYAAFAPQPQTGMTY